MFLIIRQVEKLPIQGTYVFPPRESMWNNLFPLTLFQTRINTRNQSPKPEHVNSKLKSKWAPDQVTKSAGLPNNKNPNGSSTSGAQHFHLCPSSGHTSSDSLNSLVAKLCFHHKLKVRWAQHISLSSGTSKPLIYQTQNITCLQTWEAWWLLPLSQLLLRAAALMPTEQSSHNHTKSKQCPLH